MWIYNQDALKKGDRSVVRISFPWTVSLQGHADLCNLSVHGYMLSVSEAAEEMWDDELLPIILYSAHSLSKSRLQFQHVIPAQVSKRCLTRLLILPSGFPAAQE